MSKFSNRWKRARARVSAILRSRRSTRRSKAPLINSTPSSKIDPKPETPSKWGAFDYLFLRASAQVQGVDWIHLKAQAIAESALDPHAVSRAGAQGVMQFMPATWSEWGSGSPFDPEQSIIAGAKYMRWLLQRSSVNGDLTKAWAAYNWGIGNLTAAIRTYGDRWEVALPKETRDYIARINRILQELNQND